MRINYYIITYTTVCVLCLSSNVVRALYFKAIMLASSHSLCNIEEVNLQSQSS